MEMDCNLKKFARFFKFILCILEKSLKIDYGVVRAISCNKTSSL